MDQDPSIGCPLFPADIFRIDPEQFDLPGSVPGVPKGVSHVGAWSCVRFDQFNLYSRLGHCSERGRLPISLLVLFPHHRVEFLIVLVAENDPHIVIVNLGVHEKGSFVVYSS